MKVCLDCPNLTTQSRCESCRKKRRRKQDKSRPSPRRRGYNRRHELDRRKYLALHPICQWPEGCLSQATDLDHIDGNPFNRDWSNYRGLCGKHHKQRTAQDQPGGWNRRVGVTPDPAA